MKLIENYNLLFVHIPKTAGMMVTNAFGDDLSIVGDKHERAKDTREWFDEWKDYTKFCTVRNPWELHLSNYMFITSNPRNSYHLYANLAGFKEVIRDGAWDIGEFVFCEQGNMLIDDVLRFESLQADWKGFCDRHEIRNKFIINYPAYNMDNCTRHLPYQEYYTEQWMIDAVAEKNKEYIKYFGYEF